jgi:hypothetical protein
VRHDEQLKTALKQMNERRPQSSMPTEPDDPIEVIVVRLLVPSTVVHGRLVMILALGCMVVFHTQVEISVLYVAA